MQINMQLEPQQLIVLAHSGQQIAEQSLAMLLQKTGVFLQTYRDTEIRLTGPQFKLNAMHTCGIFKACHCNGSSALLSKLHYSCKAKTLHWTWIYSLINLAGCFTVRP